MRIETLADHRRDLARSSELVAEPGLARLPYRIEIDRLDLIVTGLRSNFK